MNTIVYYLYLWRQNDNVDILVDQYYRVTDCPEDKQKKKKKSDTAI